MSRPCLICRCVPSLPGSNVYATGTTGSGGTFGNQVVSSGGGSDCALWKLNSQGTTEWALTGGGTAAEECHGVAVHAVNTVHTVIVTGFTSSDTATFGDIVLNPGAGSGINSFLWKLSPDGTTLWAVLAGAGSSGYVKNYAVTVDGIEGNIYSAGTVSGSSATFGGGVVSTQLTGQYSFAHLWKVSAAGTTLSAASYGSKLGYNNGVHVDATPVNSVAVVGSINNVDATFGDTVLASAGQKDYFLFKAVDSNSNAVDTVNGECNCAQYIAAYGFGSSNLGN
mgnify:CR=1 FL=1